MDEPQQIPVFTEVPTVLDHQGRISIARPIRGEVVFELRVPPGIDDNCYDRMMDDFEMFLDRWRWVYQTTYTLDERRERVYTRHEKRR